jgi:hypothetical protein
MATAFEAERAMAQATEDIATRVDWLLGYLFGEWEDIPHLADEWDALDHVQRVHALIDWPVVESNLRALEEYAAQGLLTPEQGKQYARLHALIAGYRPVLQQMLKD